MGIAFNKRHMLTGKILLPGQAVGCLPEENKEQE
jgi:hypothetical protein